MQMRADSAGRVRTRMSTALVASVALGAISIGLLFPIYGKPILLVLGAGVIFLALLHYPQLAIFAILSTYSGVGVKPPFPALSSYT